MDDLYRGVHVGLLILSICTVVFGLIPGIVLLTPSVANQIVACHPYQGCRFPFERLEDKCCQQIMQKSSTTPGELLKTFQWRDVEILPRNVTNADRIHSAQIGLFFLGKGPALFDFYVDDAHHVTVLEAVIILYLVCFQLFYSMWRLRALSAKIKIQ
jgi:hypothetical protein